VIPWGGIRQTDRVITIPAGITDIQQAAQSQLAQGDELLGQPEDLGSNQYRITYQYHFQIASLNIGVLYVLAVLSLSVYGVVIGGWASNNKYSFLGGLRATANMISYEIPLGLAVLTIVVMFGTLDMNELVEKQCHNWVGIIPAWNVFSNPSRLSCFLSAFTPRPIGRRLTLPRRSRNSWADITRNIAPCVSPCFSLANMPG
jgi:hypothetical protein